MITEYGVTICCTVKNSYRRFCVNVCVTDSRNNIVYCKDTMNDCYIKFQVPYCDEYKIKISSVGILSPYAICKWAYLTPNSNRCMYFIFNKNCIPICQTKNFGLTDYHYRGLPIQDAQIYLRSQCFMASPYTINITNGTGQEAVLNGSYNVTSATTGYDNASILPVIETITAGVNSYALTIAATGTLTLNVTEDGTSIGVPVQGAVFYRCDSAGNTYGSPVTSDVNGDAIFDYVPFAATGAPLIYYKQTASDGNHEFDPALVNTTMTTSTKTVEVLNAPAATRTFALTDVNYAGLPLATGSVTLTAI